MMTAAILCFAASAVLLQVPQRPPRDATPPSERPPAGIISGRVFAADTGMPLRRMYVTLMPVDVRGIARPRHVATDGQGRFQFTDLGPGTYRLRAAPNPHRAQYVAFAYGARRPGDIGRTIELTDGQTITDANIALPRGGAIPGRVLDEDGDPVSRAMVFASRVRSAGVQFQRWGMTAQTDDHGRFRRIDAQGHDHRRRRRACHGCDGARHSGRRFGSPRVRTATVMSQGRFRAEKVLSGRYDVIALQREGLYLSPDTAPAIVESVLPNATIVVVAEGETRTVDLRIVRAPLQEP